MADTDTSSGPGESEAPGSGASTSAGTGHIVVSATGATDPGLVRQSNEDALAVGNLDGGARADDGEVLRTDGSRGPLLIVCDGMGGVVGGEVASRLATDVIWEEMLRSRPTAERLVYARLLRRSLRAAHQRLLDEGQARPELRGMGTTVSAAGIAGGALLIAQVGDSRAYIQRRTTLTQVTRDQSVVSTLVHAGRMNELEARLSEKRSLILQALGAGDDVDVALSLVELRRGDRLLLCSDGLHGPVNDEAIRHTLDTQEDLGEAVRALVGLARQGGAPDNVTCILARFDGDVLPLPVGDDDRPRFVEVDITEDGERALTSTSVVARRLAARAGLRADTRPPPLPATGQH
ncbi:MAG TPA: protein phosphatase 2C domain-containing protein, partial [Kofleriaceae bacterium]|nr:protein phosphatase 2C domain-containing protein [Kofleriaceae bacterium]